MNNYDITFIGTGPINLLSAYLVLKKNPSLNILFIDNTDCIGGAWKYEISDKGHLIECGCHIWSYCPEVYQFIENDLNIPLIRLTPIFIKGKIRIPYSFKVFFNSYAYLLSNSLLLKTSKLKKLKDSPQINLSIIKKYKYPITGSQLLISKLHHELKKFPTVNFNLNKTVKNIEIQENISLTINSTKIQSKRVFLTSLSNIEYIQTDTDNIKIEKRKTNYVHFLIEVSKKPKKLIQYHRLMSDKVIHRITDISYQTKNKEHLLLFGIKNSAYHSYSQEYIMDYITTYLIKNKIIDSTYPIKLLKEHIYPTYYVQKNQRKIINHLDPRVKLNHSTDLMYGMYKLLKEHNYTN